MAERLAAPGRQLRRPRRGLASATDLAALLIVAVWGGSYTVIKSALGEVAPLAFALARFGVASALLLPLAALLGRRAPWAGLRGRDLATTVVVGILTVGAYQMLFSAGLKLTTAANSALLVASSPVFTILFARALGVERPRPLQWLGVGLSLAGVAVLTLGQGKGLSFSLRGAAGDLLTVGAAASYGVSTVLAKPVLDRHPTLPVMAVAVAAGTLSMVPFCLHQALEQNWALVSAAGWLKLGYAALPAGALAYPVWYYAVGRLGPTRVTAFTYLVPVGAVALAVAFLGESLGWRGALGAAVVLSGVGLTRWGGARPGREGGRRGAELDQAPGHRG